METQSHLNKTFSNHSINNWNSKRCQFCMYHELIFDQLQRLKEAIDLKNQRIKQLQQFIAKISQMAFLKSPLSPSTNAITNTLSPKANDSSLQFQNESSAHFEKQKVPGYFKKRFEQSSQISFSQSKQNTAKFETKKKQTISDLNSRLQKINQLNELKRQLKKKMQQSVNKQNSRNSNKIQSFNNSRQFDTLRTLSQPQQQGHINSIVQSSCQNSRIKQFNQRKNKFEAIIQNQSIEQTNLVNSQSQKHLMDDNKNSINIIKQYIRRLK